LYLRLNQAFDVATRFGWLPKSPMIRVGTPKHVYKRKALWTVDDLQHFLSCSGRWQPLWLLAVASGARIGELLGLTWPDVDLDAGLISISRTVGRLGTKRIVGPPKTEAGNRIISIPPQAVSALREWQNRQLEELNRLCVSNADQWVWTTDEGKPAQYNTALLAFGRDSERAQLKGSPHGLRHLHASVMIAGGLPITELARRLGHSNAAITGSIYAHALSLVDKGGEIAARFLPAAPTQLLAQNERA
jgi:integrase